MPDEWIAEDGSLWLKEEPENCYKIAKKNLKCKRNWVWKENLKPCLKKLICTENCD